MTKTIKTAAVVLGMMLITGCNPIGLASEVVTTTAGAAVSAVDLVL